MQWDQTTFTAEELISGTCSIGAFAVTRQGLCVLGSREQSVTVVSRAPAKAVPAVRQAVVGHVLAVPKR